MYILSEAGSLISTQIQEEEISFEIGMCETRRFLWQINGFESK